jgi:molybdenum cofactor biosynthesis enzyme MoaA
MVQIRAMAPNRTIQKVIDGRLYVYDGRLDVIHEGAVRVGYPYDRTQVSVPVDACVELTTACNWNCINCFSESSPSWPGRYADAAKVVEVLRDDAGRLIRVCVTGGEPLMHPDVEKLIRLPAEMRACGFVLSTNGSVRSDIDPALIENQWLVAISVHGRELTHNKYTRARSFGKAVDRVCRLARETVVHIYTVLHDGMGTEDLEFVLRLRDECGAAFVRFIAPRPFGRYELLGDDALVKEAARLADDRAGVKMNPSLTRFLPTRGPERISQ